MGGWMQGSGRLQQSGQLWTGGGQGRNGQRRKVGHTRPVTTGQSLRKSLAWPEHPPALTQMSASRDFPAPSGCPFFQLSVSFIFFSVFLTVTKSLWIQRCVWLLSVPRRSAIAIPEKLSLSDTRLGRLNSPRGGRISNRRRPFTFQVAWRIA